MSRDTQFMGYAKALVTEIINQVPTTIYPLEIDISDKLEKLLARRAYDFACDVVSQLDSDVMWRIGKGYDVSEIVENDIADIIELSKEQSPMDQIEENARQTMHYLDPYGPRKISITLNDGKKYEGIVHYTGDEKGGNTNDSNSSSD
jgi:hypothetical protein